MNKCIKKNKALFSVLLSITLINSVLTVAISLLLKEVFDIALGSNFDDFITTLLITVIFLIFFGIIQYTYGVINNKFINKVTNDYRSRIYNGIMLQSMSNYMHSPSSDNISYLSNDIKMIEDNYLKSLTSVIQQSFTFISTFCALMYLSPIATVSMFVSTLLMLVAPKIFARKLQIKHNEYSNSMSSFISKLKDLLSGFEVIKTYRIENISNKIFQEENNHVFTAKMNVDKMEVMNSTVSSFLAMLSQFVIIFTGAYLIMDNQITAGTLIALIQLSGSFVMPIMLLLSNYPKIMGMKPLLDKLDNIAYSKLVEKSEGLASFDQEISIKNISFSYDKTKKNLDQISFDFKKGKKYVIVGQSGCGKSTLVKLISGYYRNFDGNINFDNINMSNFTTSSIMKLSSIVHQQVYMFNTTIKNNITLFQNYNDNEIEEALRLSGVDLMISEISNGLDTIAGENGNKLSGGQKQRIAVARALINKTPILILDEGTSAIDSAAAYDIEHRLLTLDGLTLVTITHQLNEDLLSKYDEVIFMSNGTIVEHGSYSKLMDSNSLFYKYQNIKSI